MFLSRMTNCTLIAIVVLLNGCSTQVTSPNQVQAPTSSWRSPTAPAQAAKDVLFEAQHTKSPERDNLLLKAAQLFNHQGSATKARDILLNDINPDNLSNTHFAEYSKTLAALELQADNTESAYRLLTNPRLERQINNIEPSLEAALRELRAQTFERTGRAIESVNERVSLSALLTNKAATDTNQETLWQLLLTLPINDLQAHAAKSGSGIIQGWYSLAALTKNNTQDIRAQQAQLSQWLKLWKNHPASGNLPKDLRVLQTLVNQQPKKIALLLPLQGRLAEAGIAVRDGFLAAFHQAAALELAHPTSAELSQPPQIREYDTSTGAIAAYQQALAEDADIIIGPLDKEDVNQISRIGAFTVPLLSLNYVSSDENPTNTAAPMANFYQFGLAIEDESRQIARQGIQAGYRRALIAVPKQEVSERSAQAFSDEWLKLGGTLVSKDVFVGQEQFSEAIKHTLLVDESNARKNLLSQQLNTKLEFTPRRRADIDMIFMAASPSQGRQIKPTFAFHYAGDIPVYASSTIYSGEQDAINNEDLNGTIFTTIPWLFDTENPIKLETEATSKSSAVYGILHALGADAFHLHARLPQLQQAPDMRLYGATGSLRLLPNGRIEREQIWAQFQNGLATPIINTPATTDSSHAEASPVNNHVF